MSAVGIDRTYRLHVLNDANGPRADIHRVSDSGMPLP
jgi:hypothetical protein